MRFPIFSVIITLLLLGTANISSQELAEEPRMLGGIRFDDLPPDPDFHPPELPGPEEAFAIDDRSAVQAVWMLRRSHLIQVVDDDLRRRTLAIHEARVVKTEPKLYTIYIRGSSGGQAFEWQELDWNRSYIHYNGRMTNLRILYSYRNQAHPFDFPVFLD
ncbi:hypothetical protein [Spirochaeta dissipatitropha]